ncbi:MAG: HIT domain-containing protein [Phycisphaerales bacterium]|nr:HIT domain-containing protein [Phycisphaerales bacterium]
MAEFERNNIWAPWRMDYIAGIDDSRGECFLCDYRGQPKRDAEHHVLHRTASIILLLNRFPYSNGHVLIAPLDHIAQPEDLPESIMFEIARAMCDAKRVLTAAVNAQGFNIGMNLGRCAGAGLPDHQHWHIVPRWSGDTNFMPVLGGVRVVPDCLDRVREKFIAAAARLGVFQPVA